MPPKRSFQQRPPNGLIDFFLGTGADPHGRSAAELTAMTHAELESTHNYIQTWFPLPEESAHNRAAWLIDEDVFTAFRSGPDHAALQTGLRGMFEIMLDFWGFQIRDVEGHPGTVEYIRGDNWAARSASWAGPEARTNHNHQRITRVIRSLRILGLEREAQAFHHALDSIAPFSVINIPTLSRWRNAATWPLYIVPGDQNAVPNNPDSEIAWLRTALAAGPSQPPAIPGNSGSALATPAGRAAAVRALATSKAEAARLKNEKAVANKAAADERARADAAEARALARETAAQQRLDAADAQRQADAAEAQRQLDDVRNKKHAHAADVTRLQGKVQQLKDAAAHTAQQQQDQQQANQQQAAQLQQLQQQAQQLQQQQAQQAAAAAAPRVQPSHLAAQRDGKVRPPNRKWCSAQVPGPPPRLCYNHLPINSNDTFCASHRPRRAGRGRRRP